MLDYLTFIEELKEIKTSLGPNTDNATMSLINKKQKKYENMVNEFESDRERIENIWDIQEKQQKLTLDNSIKS
jgi:hypothetical protein